MQKIYSWAVRIAVLLALLIFPGMPHAHAYTSDLANRSVTVGSSVPSAVTTHKFDFSLTDNADIGSIVFEYCSNTPFVGSSCDAPTGLSVGSANLDAQTGETGFSIDGSSTNNKIVLTRAATNAVPAPVSYTFSNIINHSTPNSTVYVRISTYQNSNATGQYNNSGAVAYATTSQLTINGYVPPYLTFCTGVTVELNCASTTGSFLNFGEFSSTQPRYLTSQFSVATNDPTGYSTTVNGLTMTSGNNIINGANPARTSQPGSSQFGLNLRYNNNPRVGADPIGVGTGDIASGFSNPNSYFFNNQVIASSPLPTDFNAFTVSYVVNVGRNQAPGIYSTTLTYIASVSF